MLEAKKNKIFEFVFALYVKNLLKRRFNSFNVSGLDNLSNTRQKLPLIVFANHSCWWDGLIVFQVLKRLAFDSFVMMEEKHLKKYPLFCKLGAFSVIRENPREAVKSLNYAVRLLKDNPQSAVIIFPQGKIVHNDQRPISFFNGISRIVEKVEHCRLVSLSIRLEFLEKFKPEIFVGIGNPVEVKVDSDFSSKHLTKQLAAQMTLCLDNLKNDILNNNLQNYQNIFD